MRAPDPDKARRVLARSRVLAERQEDARWLASLTPEHRAFHEQKSGWPCGECISAGIDRLNASIARLKAQVAARHDRATGG